MAPNILLRQLRARKAAKTAARSRLSQLRISTAECHQPLQLPEITRQETHVV
jgi:hypothetical protein